MMKPALVDVLAVRNGADPACHSGAAVLERANYSCSGRAGSAEFARQAGLRLQPVWGRRTVPSGFVFNLGSKSCIARSYLTFAIDLNQRRLAAPCPCWQRP